MSAGFRHDHLLEIAQLSAEDVVQILDAAEAFIEVSRRPVRKVPTLTDADLPQAGGDQDHHDQDHHDHGDRDHQHPDHPQGR